MLISDLARQYKNTTASTESMNGTRGVEKLVSTVRELTAGNVFEGTVNSIQNGRVMLGLSNGTELAARLDANMQLVKGQSMFFQVKSNDGATIAIRPYTVDGAGVNLTLLNALKAAGLPVTDKYLNMANAMMQEQMPIDKNSMMQMARILMANPNMNVNTIVQMKKLDIPITNEMAAQFENYMDDTSALHQALDQFLSEFPTLLSGKEISLEQLKLFDSQFLQILAEGMEDVPQSENIKESGQMENTSDMVSNTESAITENTDAKVSADNITDGKQTAEPIVRENFTESVKQMPTDTTTEIEMDMKTQTMPDKMENSASEGSIKNQMEQEIEHLIRKESLSDETGNILQNDPVKHTVPEKVVKLLDSLLGTTGITTQDSAASMLQKLSAFLLDGNKISKEMLQQLFSSKDMKTFLRSVMEEQMYLQPQEVAEGENVKKLYARLNSKTQKLENLLADAGWKNTSLGQTLSDVRGNINFMNQLNQVYTYVQIPLKMSGQNTQGELYVYTNKRDLGDPERELTAFLHLDMDYLGSTDVSVRLHRKKVDTKFYMDSDAAYDLVKAHMTELEERLRKKGFYANIQVENEGKKVNFVEDFLKKDAPSSGQLHRYSFDVRA